MDADVFRAWIVSAAGVIEANRDHLTQLDAAIGDADHGINLARGLHRRARRAGRRGGQAATPGAVLTLTGNTLISKVGGASGPLYGTAFRRAGKALGGAADVDLAALAAALDAALAGVQQLGAAREGDKTMVDALAPAARAFSKAIAEGASPDDALSVLAEAATAGAAATVPMQALKGRASYLGPRSVGHEDPGAASTALILGALRGRRAGRTMTAAQPLPGPAGVRGHRHRGALPRRRSRPKRTGASRTRARTTCGRRSPRSRGSGPRSPAGCASAARTTRPASWTSAR